MSWPPFVSHQLVRYRLKLKIQGHVWYLLGNRLSMCQFLAMEIPISNVLIPYHLLIYPLGFLVIQVAQCLSHFQPHGRSMEGFALEHQDLG
jgi:hypothetical protein